MRLHRLRATAFGPFASTIDVDFDQLSTAGLFLLSGPTGAGKTSVLDAVCFALYGDVPGDRNAAKRLRSDLAAPGTRPEVELEATLSGRRFRIVRSPSWERPKKRGDGTTTEQASVTIAERIQGSWVTQSTRLDETGHLVARLLGMNVAQFTQVAMLPQGRFQAFLRAKSEERHRLLQQLFRTGRFEDVEKWLRDHRLELRRRTEQARETVADLVSRVSETTGAQPPADVAPEAWARALLDDAVTASADAAIASERGSAAELSARTALDTARELHHHRARVDAALAERRRLDEATEEHAIARRRLDAARRASGIVPLHRVAVSAQRAYRAARTAAVREDRPQLEREVAEAVDGVARLRALAPRLRRLEAVTVETSRLERRATELTASAEQALAERREQIIRLTHELSDAEEAHRAARQHTLDQREHAVGLREQRVNGMAAEIAAGLAVGGSCPVCGSCDHPHKAVAPDGAPDEAAEKDAQKAADDAAVTEFALAGKVQEIRAALTTATEQTDTVPPDIATASSATAAALDALATEAAALRVELADYDEERLAVLQQTEHEARAALTALDRLVHARAALADAERAVAEAVAESTFADAAEALQAALDERAYDALARQVAEQDRRIAAVAAVLDEAGAEEVAAATLPDLRALADAHEQALRRHREAHAHATETGRRTDRLRVLTTDLDAAVAAWRPLDSELGILTRLSSFVEGKSADNRLQMRLSAYVLAYRLSQVVAAANERLDRMSDRRYTLEHTGRRGAGETRGGLSLVIRDDWSGEARDPATLSGGETFVVSLALALGLADVVTQEAGGADLDTLFVDEGFGALDADTLDDVMDTLDSLRDGGRVVGVVSHVAEMRDRIPTQLLVAKSRSGSTVTISR